MSTIQSVSIGNRRVTDQASGESLSEMACRILVAIATSMRGPATGWTSGDLAARLRIHPRTAERDDLNRALWELHARALASYRGNAVAGEAFEWHLSDRGIEIAQDLPTGISGGPRRG